MKPITTTLLGLVLALNASGTALILNDTRYVSYDAAYISSEIPNNYEGMKTSTTTSFNDTSGFAALPFQVSASQNSKANGDVFSCEQSVFTSSLLRNGPAYIGTPSLLMHAKAVYDVTFQISEMQRFSFQFPMESREASNGQWSYSANDPVKLYDGNGGIIFDGSGAGLIQPGTTFGLIGGLLPGTYRLVSETTIGVKSPINEYVSSEIRSMFELTLSAYPTPDSGSVFPIASLAIGGMVWLSKFRNRNVTA